MIFKNNVSNACVSVEFVQFIGENTKHQRSKNPKIHNS